MKVCDIKTPVSSIAGIGPQLTKTFAKVNVFTVGDLLQYFPRDYEDRTRKVTFRERGPNGKVHTVAQVISQEWFGYGKMRTLKVIISDGTATAELICFNRAFLEKTLAVGTVITVTGQFFVKYNRLQSSVFEVSVMNNSANNISAHAVTAHAVETHTVAVSNAIASNVAAKNASELISVPPANTGVIPVYPLTEGLTQKVLSKIILNALSQYAHGIDDEIPAQFIQKRGLISKNQAIIQIHKPQTL